MRGIAQAFRGLGSEATNSLMPRHRHHAAKRARQVLQALISVTSSHTIRRPYGRACWRVDLYVGRIGEGAKPICLLALPA
jgi:hypothetical protein